MRIIEALTLVKLFKLHDNSLVSVQGHGTVYWARSEYMLMTDHRLKLCRFSVLLSYLLLMALGTTGKAQTPKITINFDNGVAGAPMTDIGTTPMFHFREQVVYGAPKVSQLRDIYPDVLSVRVHPSSMWNGIDVVPILDATRNRMDFWFGDPFSGGVRSSYNIVGVGSLDLKADNPVPGYDFRPERIFVVGDRLVAYCAIFEQARNQLNKIAVLSAAVTDIQTGVADPWTIHFVSNEYDSIPLKVGALWAASTPILAEGAYWTVMCDYDNRSKEGGQSFLVKIDPDGTPLGMVRLYTRSGQTSEHWHGGAILFDGSSYKVIWHMGDTDRRLVFREITSILDFENNASVDLGSGIGTQYHIKNASSLDWGPLTVAGGPDETTTLTNSRWKNAFVLAPDPNDPSKFFYGGDTSGGMIERVTIDNHGVAVCETVFNPTAKNVRMANGRQSARFDVFFVAQNGSKMVALANNELDRGDGAPNYTGVIQSEDGGNTWGWVWRGGVLNGVAVLSDGRILASTNTSRDTLRGIIPGAKRSGFPAFFGYRPPNLLGDASQQTLVADGGGEVVSVGSNPELALPPIVHTEEAFSIERNEGSPLAFFEIIHRGLPQAPVVTSNIQFALWTRRKFPTSSSEADRMMVESQFSLESPGALFGTPTQTYMPTPSSTSNDWIRLTGSYNGGNMTGTFSFDPGDLRSRLKARGLGVSTGNSEVLFEAIAVDHDRPPLPYITRTSSGVSSGKFEHLGLGPSWTMLVVMQMPEETWDAWSGNEADAWDTPAPLLTISDASDTNYITFQGLLSRTAKGGNSGPFIDGIFNWGLVDSHSSVATDIPDFPQRTVPVIVAISKDGLNDLQYALGGAQGVIFGSRPMPSLIDADTLRFSDINESDALEIYVHQIQANCSASSAGELGAMVTSLSFPSGTDGSQCTCPPDLNGDGILDFFDISVFIQALGANDPVGDFNHDGIFNFFDVSSYLQSFSAGCP